MPSFFSYSFTLVAVFATKLPNSEKVQKDAQYGKFIASELNYTNFLSVADYSASKIVPMQDTSNDTFFRVGMQVFPRDNIDVKITFPTENSGSGTFRIHKSQLENYTSLPIKEHLGDIKKRPWIPVQSIKEELANCLDFKYGSLSENDFKYDKGVYGWMNIMKFSCAAIGPEFYVYAMAFARTRFRLKQVYLRRQNRYWATSGRSITTRDIQKIVEILSIQFSEYVNEKLEEELKMLNGNAKKKYNKGSFLKLPSEVLDKMKEIFPANLKHTSSAATRAHSFSTVAFPVKTRIILAKEHYVPQIVENFSPELSDDACEVLDSCPKSFCSMKKMNNLSFTSKTDTHHFLKEVVLSYKVSPAETLLAYQVAKPYFSFEVTKRKTGNGVVEVRQEVDEVATMLWDSLLDQQFCLAVRMHSQNMFIPSTFYPTPTTYPPDESVPFPQDYVDNTSAAEE